MLARILPLRRQAPGREASSTTASMHRVSQETGSDSAHQPRSRGGTEEFHSCSRHPPSCGCSSLPLPPSHLLDSHVHIFTRLAPFCALTTAAHAVIVRGTVTDPLGAVVVGARVQLVQGKRPSPSALTDPDGSFEIRSTEPGRFILLTSAATFTPGIGQDFYGGRTDVVTRNITSRSPPSRAGHRHCHRNPHSHPADQRLRHPHPASRSRHHASASSTISVRPRQSPSSRPASTAASPRSSSAAATPPPTKSSSTASPPTTSAEPSTSATSPAPASPVSKCIAAPTPPSTAPTPGPPSSISKPHAAAPSAPCSTTLATRGNFHTYRNEVALSGAHNKLDYYTAFSRFDTSNSIPRDRFHSATSVANLGYDIATNTQARFTIRNAVSAIGLPQAHNFYGISADGKQADQDIYSGLTLENRSEDNWHNLVRYDIARKREQEQQFTNVGTPITFDFGAVPTPSPSTSAT